MKWVKASERLPEESQQPYFAIYGRDQFNLSKGTLHVNFFAQWNVIEWLDESPEETKEAFACRFAEWIGINNYFESSQGNWYRQENENTKRVIGSTSNLLTIFKNQQP